MLFSNTIKQYSDWKVKADNQQLAGYYSIKSLTDLAHKKEMFFDVLFVQFH